MLSQIWEVTLMNLRNLPSRLGSSSVIVVGIAGVVGVLIGLLSMASGFAAALEGNAGENRAIVLRAGATSEMNGNLSREELNIVSLIDGVVAASGELFVVADIPKKTTNTPANVVIRGVSDAAFEVRPEVKIVSGRMFETGRNEVIAGIKAADQFSDLQIGDEVQLRGDAVWQVVGHFSADGAAYEGEVWSDLATTQAAFRRGSTMNTMRLILQDEAAAQLVSEAIEADPRLEVALQTEKDYYQKQSQGRADLINTFGYTVAMIMAVGAVFAALNTMYSAVSARTVEIATLRALGFGNTPVVISVMLEALMLALAGGLLGGLIVYLAFDGYTASTLNNASFSQVAFDFAVTPELLTQGLTWALLLGLIGGLFPAVRAARLPITTALRGE